MGKNAELTLTPLGDKIKFRVTGRVMCSRLGMELRKSGTHSREDLLWRQLFGSRDAIRSFLKRNRTVKMVVPLSTIYSYCDRVV